MRPTAPMASSTGRRRSTGPLPRLSCVSRAVPCFLRISSQRGYLELQNTRPLKLIELGGKGLARLGATAEILHSGLPYDVPHAWSKALHDHPAIADGIAYGARNDDRELCYALFDRSRTAVTEASPRVASTRTGFGRSARATG